MNLLIDFNKLKAKVLLGANRLLKYRTLDMFDAVEIETNTECNRKCLYCPNSLYRRGRHSMELRLYKKIIGELSRIKFNGRLSPHFYNEPLLDERLPLLINYAREKLPEAFICIYTNGDLLDRKLFDELIKSGADNFFVTQHGKELGSGLKRLMNSLNEKEKKRITVRVFGDKDTFTFNRGGLLKLDSKKFNFCSFPSTSIVINWKGEIILCCNDYFCKHVLGDLKKNKLMDIWKSKNYKKLGEA
ncbi:MAG: SPASM domain-containing protein [Candidatus Diapherotrites archaeon]